MAFDKYLIAPQEVGLQLNVKPWLIANDAYEQMDNCYAFRGTIRKRFGATLMGTGAAKGFEQLYSRLRVKIGTTDNAGKTAAPIALPGIQFNVGQAFSIGAVMFTVATASSVTPNILPSTATNSVIVGTTDLLTGDLTVNIAGFFPGPYVVGQSFTVGTTVFTITALGLPAALTPSGSSIGTATFNTTTGDLVITGSSLNTPVVFHETVATLTITAGSPPTATFSVVSALALTDIYYYPSLPVMGFSQFQPDSPINNKKAYAFDEQFAYLFGGGFWARAVGATTDPVWHGDDTNFFWTCNWEGITPGVGGVYQQAMFVTNFQVKNPTGLGVATDDPIWYRTENDWFILTPIFQPDPAKAYGNGAFVLSSLLIVAFKNRLILLNTIENDGTGDDVLTFGSNTAHINRARWSHNGSPFSYNAWYQNNSYDSAGGPTNTADGASYLDASTDEAIISCEFIKDRLIVQFERSTWELAYTNNEGAPFIWQKLNTELGCDSTFSSVPFDQYILSVGQTGVHSCNGSNVERIDAKIPDEVFKIKNPTDGVKRVHGIRDYFTEMVYWSFPKSNQAASQPFPQRILVYNYQNKSWAFNDDCVTAFGYFEQQQGSTWASSTIPWSQAYFSWDSGQTQANFRQVIAGNQEGFCFIIRPDISRNSPSSQITTLSFTPFGAGDFITMTVINHSLLSGDYVLIENIVDAILAPALTANIATTINGNIYQINVVDEDTISFAISGSALSGQYLGAGTTTRVSNLGIKSRQWNPYIDKGMNVMLGRVDFCVDRTNNGQVTVDYSPSACANMSMIYDMTLTGTNLGTNILETSAYPNNDIEDQSTRLWHSVYFSGIGECIQLFIYMSYEQMTDPTIALEDFRLQGLILNTQPSSSFLQG